MHPFLDRVLDGVCVDEADICLYNAGVVERRVAAFKRSPCSEAGGKRRCMNKNCSHGGTASNDLAFARTLREEAAAIRDARQA